MKRMMRFHPAYISQRKLMKEMQDKGYNDIFIPNMKKLSPDYKIYHEAKNHGDYIGERIDNSLRLIDQAIDSVCQNRGGYL